MFYILKFQLICNISHIPGNVLFRNCKESLRWGKELALVYLFLTTGSKIKLFTSLKYKLFFFWSVTIFPFCARYEAAPLFYKVVLISICIKSSIFTGVNQKYYFQMLDGRTSILPSLLLFFLVLVVYWCVESVQSLQHWAIVIAWIGCGMRLPERKGPQPRKRDLTACEQQQIHL